jgi:hypothetical protein
MKIMSNVSPIVLCVALGACCGMPTSLTERPKAVAIERVVNQVKDDLRRTDWRPILGTVNACDDPKSPVKLIFNSADVTLALQTITVVDLTVDASGKGLPFIGVPLISPFASLQRKATTGEEVNITFGQTMINPIGLPPETTPSDLGVTIAAAASGLFNADHSPPCLTPKYLTIVRSFDVVYTATVGAEIGFKLLYSAGFKATDANQLKNTVTVKLDLTGSSPMFR